MARPGRVYEVLGTHPLAADAARRLAAFDSGLAAWRNQRWPEAKRWFEQVLALAPEDLPSRIYLERCRHRLAGRPEASAAK
jgi:adenylate cyclase